MISSEERQRLKEITLARNEVYQGLIRDHEQLKKQIKDHYEYEADLRGGLRLLRSCYTNKEYRTIPRIREIRRRSITLIKETSKKRINLLYDLMSISSRLEMIHDFYDDCM